MVMDRGGRNGETGGDDGDGSFRDVAYIREGGEKGRVEG